MKHLVSNKNLTRILSVLIFVLSLLGVKSKLYAQTHLITFDNETGEVYLPFEYINNFIIVSLRFNNVPLKFIVDTGAENSILTHREISDLLGVPYNRSINILGADMETELTAHIITGITIKLADELTVLNQSLLVLEEDYFRFHEFAGVGIQGILGADFLRRFVVHIDFKQKKIRLQAFNFYKGPRKNYTQLDTEFFRYRPYVTLPGSINASTDKDRNLKLLVDTGAGIPLLIHTNSDSTLQLPEHVIRATIGRGLGGSIYGYLGRTSWIQLNEHKLEQVVTNFQDIPERRLALPVHLNNRNGILGNQVLDRFNILINYIGEEIYIKPNRNFRKKFRYDRSGISLAVSGKNLNTFSIMNIIEGSPADEADLQVGDVIKSVNGLPVFFLNLDSLIRTFQRKEGKRIRLVLVREGERMVCEFYLRDLI